MTAITPLVPVPPLVPCPPPPFPLALHAAPGYPVSTQQSSASRARVEAAGAAMVACPELCPAEVAGQSHPPLSMLEERHSRRPHRPGPVLSRSDGEFGGPGDSTALEESAGLTQLWG